MKLGKAAAVRRPALTPARTKPVVMATSTPSNNHDLHRWRASARKSMSTSAGYSARSDDAVLVRGKENFGTAVKSAPAASTAANPMIRGTRGTTVTGTTPRDGAT